MTGGGPAPGHLCSAPRGRLALLLGLVTPTTVACADERLWRELELSDSIASAAREAARPGPPSVLVLPEAVPFAWSRVHVFPPYTSRATLEASLGPEAAAQLADTRIDRREDVTLLVFAHGDGAVVESLALPRRRADFASVPGQAGIERDAAVFLVEPDRRHPGWLRVLPPAARASPASPPAAG